VSSFVFKNNVVFWTFPILNTPWSKAYWMAERLVPLLATQMVRAWFLVPGNRTCSPAFPGMTKWLSRGNTTHGRMRRLHTWQYVKPLNNTDNLLGNCWIYVFEQSSASNWYEKEKKPFFISSREEKKGLSRRVPLCGRETFSHFPSPILETPSFVLIYHTVLLLIQYSCQLLSISLCTSVRFG
jgi:hypothetical protein